MLLVLRTYLASQAKIDNFYVTLASDENVGRLQVSMNDVPTLSRERKKALLEDRANHTLTGTLSSGHELHPNLKSASNYGELEIDPNLHIPETQYLPRSIPEPSKDSDT